MATGRRSRKYWTVQSNMCTILKANTQNLNLSPSLSLMSFRDSVLALGWATFGVANMKKIPLTRGLFAVIDDEDFEEVSKLTWQAYKTRQYIYAYNARTKPNGGGVYLHRLLTGVKKGEMVDHINHDTLDCRRVNLRICTNKQNQANQKPKVGGKSKYKGVYPSCKKWIATIRDIKNSNKLRLGRFETELEAAIAYDKKAFEMYGEFAYSNDEVRKHWKVMK